MLKLRIAELRKKNNMTQQELGDYLSVSYQTVSKWETGAVLPDVTMLPLLPEGSKYVGVDFSEEMLDAAREMYAADGAFKAGQRLFHRHENPALYAKGGAS